MKYYVADRETGNFMEEVKNINEGIEIIKQFEEEDKANDCYEENYYEVVDEEHHTVYSDYYGIDERVKITIKALRESLGLSAQKFGDKYGIPMRTIQNWENGTSKCPEYVINLLQRVIEAE